MRSGTWAGAVSTDNVRVTVAGVVRAVKKVDVTRSMRDGHPAAEGAQAWCTEATIEWDQQVGVTATSPHPFGGSTAWVPAEGDSVVVETGDGARGQWWVLHRGVIDSTTGSIADGTAVSKTVDGIEDLTSRVQFGALTSRMTPLLDTDTTYREIGLSSTYMVDRMLRNPQEDGVGWFATPPKTWQTVGSAPGMGSLWPEVGTLLSGSKRGDTNSGPPWIKTEYGLSPVNYVAEYQLASPADAPILSCRLGGYGGSSTGRITVCDADGNGVFLGLDTATDEIIYGSVTTGGPSWRVPRNGATRAAIYFVRNTTTSQTLKLRLSDGREWTQDPGATGYPNGWAATRVRIDSRAALGWWIVETGKDASQRWATLDHTPTARQRVGDIEWWAASRDLPWTDPAQWLGEQVEAECSAMWLDEDGVMQWAGRGVLDAQPAAQTVTSAIDLDDITWEARRSSRARSVWVTYLEPSFRLLLGGARQNVWQDDSIDLGPGEEEVVTISIPDDQDWVAVDLSSDGLNAETTPNDLRVGSKHGAALYDPRDETGGQSWAIGVTVGIVRTGLRSLRYTVASWSSNPSWSRIKTAIPETADKLAAWHHGKPSVRLRAKGVTTWTEGERSLNAGAVGPSRYSHDVGWRVQTVGSNDCVGTLLSWLRRVVSSTNPTVTGLVVAHDPRRQVGDVLRAEDRHVTGKYVEVICQDIDTDVAAFTDTITGRVLRWGGIPGLDLHEPSGPTALTPLTDWTRRVP